MGIYMGLISPGHLYLNYGEIFTVISQCHTSPSLHRNVQGRHWRPQLHHVKGNQVLTPQMVEIYKMKTIAR